MIAGSSSYVEPVAFHPENDDLVASLRSSVAEGEVPFAASPDGRTVPHTAHAPAPLLYARAVAVDDVKVVPLTVER